MLNRLYIVVGILAILLLGAAFVVPSFIPWGDYRDRLAELASGVLGAPVRIEGDIHFTLLPQPRLEFAKVSSGPEGAPNLTVQSVEAEFSLIDFLRDRYTLTRLELSAPHIEVHVGSDGSVDTGLMLPQSSEISNISIASAIISNGEVEISDNRSGETYTASGIAGEVKVDALRGPFSFSGSGTFEGQAYGLRITTSALADDNSTEITASLRPSDEGYSLNLIGTFAPGLHPTFSGTMAFRQPPPTVEGEKPDVGRGDVVVTSRVEANPSKVLLGDYTVVPDENRPATRLVGAADLTLGTNMKFNAVISGGVVALPPRDATAENAVEPYELVRLLHELPIPAAPGLPGTVGIDVAQLDLRAFSLRNVRLDATARDGGWTVDGFTGDLPGDSKLQLSGRLTTGTGHAEFSGNLALTSERLDALSTVWRQPADGNPLFNMPGSIKARANLVGETLSLSDGQVTLDGESYPFSAQVGLGATRDLHIAADLGSLDPGRSAALLALLPDLTKDPAFGITFPSGIFDISAERMTLSGLEGSHLRAEGSWDGGVLVLDEFSAADLGGAKISSNLTAFGSLERPELSGTASIMASSFEAPAVQLVLDDLGAPEIVRDRLKASFPADLTLKLGAPTGEGAQTLEASGTVGLSRVKVSADIAAGFLRTFDGSIRLNLDLDAPDSDGLFAQLGLGDQGPFPQGQPAHLAALVEGDVGASLKATLFAEGGGDSLGFSGDVVVTDPDRLTGKGTLKATLGDPSVVLTELGADGLFLPSLSGSATLEFAGSQDVKLSSIEGAADGGSFSGQLAYGKTAGAAQVSGKLSLQAADAPSLLRTLAGPASLLSSGGVWSDGPLDTGTVSRSTSGRVEIDVKSIAVADRYITDARFDLSWDATGTRIRDFSGKFGDGSISLEFGVCCSSALADKQMTGRIGLTQVAVSDIAPIGVSNLIGGMVNASGQFSATSDSVLGLLSSLTGEGTYTVDGLTISKVSPRAIGEVSNLDSLLEQDPDQLTAVVRDRLDDGSFAAPQVTGSFTIAGGVLRSPNLTISGDDGAMFGGFQVRLSDLGLSGSYTIAPPAVIGASTNISQPKVTANLAGTVLEPAVTYDVSSLVDAIMVKAYEAEVARLEKARAEEEARKRAEAEEKAAAEEAAKQAAEDAAAIKAADEAAAKKAAEAEAERKAAEQRAQAEALRRAQEEASKPLDLFGN